MARTHKSIFEVYNYRSSQTLEQAPQELFPLPPAPSAECRDAFLKRLLEPYEGTWGIEASSSEESLPYGKVRFGTHDPETMVMEEFIRWQSKSITSRKSYFGSRLSSSKPFISNPIVDERAMDIVQLLKERYGDIANAIGIVAVLFELNELKNRLSVVHQMWPVKTNADPSIHMFSWSIQHYFTRFKLDCQAYLGALENELKGQMDCYKFRMDIKEIIRLIDEVTEDFRNRRDICTNSMLVIKDAEIDVMKMLRKSKRDAEAQSKQLSKDMQMTPTSADPKHARFNAIQDKINYLDFALPIEARYQFKWADTTVEQSLMHDEHSLKKITDEVQHLKEQNVEADNLWELSCLAYDMEIFNLKSRINEMETLYDVNMERVETEIDLTRNKLIKAKEDLRCFKEQVPYFHFRIAEVLEIFKNQHKNNSEFLINSIENNSNSISKTKKKLKKHSKKRLLNV